MAGRLCVLLLWMCLFLMIPDECLSKGRGNVDSGVRRVERKVMKKLKKFRNSLQNDLRSTIKLQFREELSNLMRQEFVRDIIRTQVISEMRRVKQQPRTTNIREGNRECLQTGEGGSSELLTCSKYLNSEGMTNRFTEYDRQIDDLYQTLGKKTDSPSNNNNTFKVLETTTLPQTLGVSSSVNDTEPHTLKPPEPREDRKRILIAPLWSRDENQFRLVNIDTNSLTKYPQLRLKYIITVTYVSKLNSLYICIESPLKIIASKLNSSRRKTIHEGVKTSDMAVDEERDIIFLTTYHPSHSISRMTIYGDEFTEIVNLTGYGRSPRTLALNPKTKTIYSCNHDKLFVVRYDGKCLTTLDTGSKLNAVTLDISNGLLYYGKDKKMMKMALSTNTSSVVTDFSVNIWNMMYYQNSVYYITERTPLVTLGAVNMVPEVVLSTPQTIRVPDVNFYSMCLIPG